MIQIDNMRKSCVYIIKNLKTGRFYIGSAFDVIKRWYEHRRELKKGIHGNTHIQRAWNLYGESNFIFEILEEVPMLLNESKLEFKKRLVEGREQYYLDTLLFAQEYIKGIDNRFKELGYNQNPIANTRLGTKHSNETKIKLSKCKLGNKYWLGKKHSNETKIKLSISHIGKLPWNKGIEQTKETKLKISKGLLGIVSPMKGIKRSKEVREKISKSLIGRSLSEEVKNKIKSKIFKKPILQFSLDGIFIKRWESIKQIERELLLCNVNIRKVCNGKRNKAYNFVWKYENNN